MFRCSEHSDAAYAKSALYSLVNKATKVLKTLLKLWIEYLRIKTLCVTIDYGDVHSVLHTIFLCNISNIKLSLARYV